jgi:hypothetical protein
MGNAQLAEGICEMIANGSLADPECVGDLLISIASSH